MKVKFINESNGVKWYTVAGQTFGMAENGRLLDESGNPFDLTHHTHDTRLFLGEVTSAINEFSKVSIAEDIQNTALNKECPTTTAIRLAEAFGAEPEQDFVNGVTSFEFDDGSILYVGDGELTVDNDNYHG